MSGTPAPNPVPKKIGRYQIVEELGHGAMGVVYKGFDPNIGRTVAIKTVLLDSGDKETIARFRREAQAAGILSHPNIVTIYDAGEDQGLFYIAMEYVQGETLQDVIRRGVLAVDRLTTIIEQIGSALDHAHANQIIHRDIKPANIMVTEKAAKIMDFGVAKISSVSLTATGLVLGTPAYMSPETVKGQLVDGRADLFSLGVVLYEMLTGVKPFAGDNIPAVIYKIISEQPAPLTTINPHLHPGLNTVLTKVLAKDPKDRYQTCAEFAADLKNYRAVGSPAQASGGIVRTAAPTAAPAAVAPPAIAPPREWVAPSAPQAAPRPAVSPAPALSSSAAPTVTRTTTLDRKALEREHAILEAHKRATTTVTRAKPSKPSGMSSETKSTLVKAAIIGAGALILLGAGVLVWKAREAAKDTQPAETKSEPAAVETPAPRKAAPSPAAAGRNAAPAAPSAVPSLLKILVTSNVEGAVIKIDGKTQPDWTTPHSIRLSPGSHRIEVSKPGYSTKNLMANLTADSPRTLNFELTPGGSAQDEAAATSRPEPPPERSAAADVAASQGRLRVLTRPPGAAVSVDGPATDYRTPVSIPITAGRHRITLEHRGVEPVTRDVVISPNQMFTLTVMLGDPGQGPRRRFPFPR